MVSGSQVKRLWDSGLSVLTAVCRRVLRRAASPPALAPGSLRRQYENCRDLFDLTQFEADNILVPVALEDEYRIAGQRFRATDVVIDIGAHVGVFSYLCYLKGSREIYSFESSQHNFDRLTRHLGGISEIHCERAIVWRSDEAGGRTLRLSTFSADNTGSSSVLGGGQAIDFAAQRIVPGPAADCATALPLDAILDRFERVKLLKVDCEGSEFPILLTSARLSKVERIVGELHECSEQVLADLPPESRVAGYDRYCALDLADWLQSLGFTVHLRNTTESIWLFDGRRIPS